MNLPLKEIRHFEACRNLRQLHITDCRLERISGLQYNTQLRELYLCATALGLFARDIGSRWLAHAAAAATGADTPTASEKSKGWTPL
jgi:hypothetical protein